MVCDRMVRLKLNGHEIIAMSYDELERCLPEDYPKVDLRKIIEDSEDPEKYIEAVRKVMEVLEREGRVAIGCNTGCGMVFVVLGIMLAHHHKDREEVEKVLNEMREKRGLECPKKEHQREMLKAVLSALEKGCNSLEELFSILREHKSSNRLYGVPHTAPRS